MNKNSLHTVRVSDNKVKSEFVSSVLAAAGTDLVFTLATRAHDYKEIIRGVNAKTNNEAREVSAIMGFDDLSYLVKFLSSSLAQELYMGKYDNNFDLTRGTKEGAYQTVYVNKNYERSIFGLNFSTNVPLSYSFPEYVEGKPLLTQYGSSFKGITQGHALGSASIQGFRERLYKLSVGVSAVLSARIVARSDYDAAMDYDKAVKNYLILISDISKEIESSSRVVVNNPNWKDDILACYTATALTMVASEFVDYINLFEEVAENIADNDELEDMSFRSLLNLFEKGGTESYDILNKDIVLDEAAFNMYLFGLEEENLRTLKNVVIESLKKIDGNLWKALEAVYHAFTVQEWERGLNKYE